MPATRSINNYRARVMRGSVNGIATGKQECSVKRAMKRHMRLIMNLWPPFLGAGIRVKRLTGNWREIDVEMKLRPWNANYVGTHYGGSLYSMADPFFMVMLIENLGKDYVVWDKSASIRFRRPGRGTVSASFRLTAEQIEEIKKALETQEKIERVFAVEVKDESGSVVAEVEKLLHVRRKDRNAG
jgi:acyl-coenzyme A thioesterase PaaI-like protein